MVRAMKTLGLLSAVLLALTGCENAHSKLDNASNPGRDTSGGGGNASAALARIEDRLEKIEEGFKIVPIAPGQNDVSVAERLHRVEMAMARYGEALEMLQGVYNQQKQQQEQKEMSEADPQAIFAVEVGPAIKAGQLEGPAQAPVTIVKAFDFACPYCEKLNAPLHELVKEYNGKVRVVYMNLVVHPDSAMEGHLYSCAAAKQGKYSAWKDAFWEKSFKPYVASRGANVQAMGEETILKYSAEIPGLNVAQLKTDAKSDMCKQRIEQDQKELMKFKVGATPALFINGTFIGGAIPKEQFKMIIDEKLKLVEASGAGAGYYDKEIMSKGLKQFRSKRDAANDRKAAAAGQPPGGTQPPGGAPPKQAGSAEKAPHK